MRGGIRTGLFNRKKESPAACVAQTYKANPFSVFDGYTPLATCQSHLYKMLREAIPIIDASIFKLVRLTIGFRVECDDPHSQRLLDDFQKNVVTNGNQHGLSAFISSYFEQLLTYGTSIGEIVLDRHAHIAGLYIAPQENINLQFTQNGLGVNFCVNDIGAPRRIKHPERILYSVLNPDPGELRGNSLLKGLPFVSNILLKIWGTIGTNWERVGNVRFSVVYKPQNDVMDKAYAKERATQIAQQWQEAMQSGGSVKDFVAVGDVSIKAIGADNQILDSEVPVRQMLEQIVAKTGIPPFMLGLSWSSTERMSSQQADVLTSELEAYRTILEPVISKIIDIYLRSQGLTSKARVVWNDITLQDEVELSRASLYSAQAQRVLEEINEEQKGGEEN